MAPPTKGYYPVKVTVLGFKGKHPCWQGKKPGDSWLLQNNETPEDFCPTAFQDIYPVYVLLANGGSFWWAENKDVVTVSCADPEVMVQYEVRRLPKD